MMVGLSSEYLVSFKWKFFSEAVIVKNVKLLYFDLIQVSLFIFKRS